MKLYIKIISIVILLLGVFCFYMAYHKFQLPFDNKGVFIDSAGNTIKRSSAVRTLILGILSVLFVLIWNFLYKKIRKKES